jgi:hypothetical protein
MGWENAHLCILAGARLDRRCQWKQSGRDRTGDGGRHRGSATPREIGANFVRSSQYGRSAYWFSQSFAPGPTTIRIPISCRDAQCPYGLIRLHHVFPEPRHLCRLTRVRHIAIPAFRSPGLSGTPGIAACLDNILLFDSSIPRPYPPRRQPCPFQEGLHRQPP